MPKYGKIVSARLTEDEIANLNIFMVKNGFTSLGDLVRAVIEGSVQIPSLTFVDKLDNVANKLLTIVDNFQKEWVGSNPRNGVGSQELNIEPLRQSPSGIGLAARTLASQANCAGSNPASRIDILVCCCMNKNCLGLSR